MSGASSELRRGNRLNRHRVGEGDEDLALRYLARKGYEPVERNYRTRHGEINLIVRDEKTLVFVEDKLRRGVELGNPLEAVTPRKQAGPGTLPSSTRREGDKICRWLRRGAL